MTRIKAWMEKKRKEDALVAALSQETHEHVPVRIGLNILAPCASVCIDLMSHQEQKEQAFARCRCGVCVFSGLLLGSETHCLIGRRVYFATDGSGVRDVGCCCSGP